MTCKNIAKKKEKNGQDYRCEIVTVSHLVKNAKNIAGLCKQKKIIVFLLFIEISNIQLSGNLN